MFVACTSLGHNVPASVGAQEAINSLPKVFTRGTDHHSFQLEESALYHFELALSRHFVGENAPDEVIALATSSPLMLTSLRQQPEELLAILIYGKKGEIRWLAGCDAKRYYHRQLCAEEIADIRKFISQNKIIDLPNLESPRIVGGKEETVIGGTAHVFLRLNAREGRRIYINNPPIDGESDYPCDDQIWTYTRLINFLVGRKRIGDVKHRRGQIWEEYKGSSERVSE